MSDVIFNDYLKQYGLTNQEAVIYGCLMLNGQSTGYEVAKQTNISRSNVYSSLSGLVDKGAAYLIEGEPARYVPVGVEKFCDNTISALLEMKDYLVAHAPQPIELSGGYVSIFGSRNIQNMINDMIEKCQYRVYIFSDPEVIERFREPIERLIAENKKVVLLTEGITIDGAIHYEMAPDDHQLRIITDSSYVLTGEYTGTDSDTCLYSGQRHLVSVLKEALEYRIKFINSTMED